MDFHKNASDKLKARAREIKRKREQEEDRKMNEERIKSKRVKVDTSNVYRKHEAQMTKEARKKPPRFRVSEQAKDVEYSSEFFGKNKAKPMKEKVKTIRGKWKKETLPGETLEISSESNSASPIKKLRCYGKAPAPALPKPKNTKKVKREPSEGEASAESNWSCFPVPWENDVFGQTKNDPREGKYGI